MTSALFADESRKCASLEGSGEVETEALVTRGRSNERDGSLRNNSRGKSSHRSKSRGRYEKGTCWNCGKKGHLKKDCRFRKGKSFNSSKENGKEKHEAETKSEANQVEESTSGVIEDEVFVASSNPTYHPNWVLDTAATHHMCPHRSWFSSYESCEGGYVLMRNNSMSQIMGVGTVQLRMFDGIVRILENVRHVPELKKSLISLSELDSRGYKYTGQGGVIKVSKGILVVMKGIRVGNLYKLLGSTVVDGAQMVIEHDEFPVRLWHRRLGHMSEKGMEILMKRELIPKMCFGDKEFFEHCVYGKHHKRSFKATSKGILDYIHSDLWGPSRTKSCGGASYFISFIDDYSRYYYRLALVLSYNNSCTIDLI